MIQTRRHSHLKQTLREYWEVIKALIFVTLVGVGAILASGLVSFEETRGKSILIGYFLALAFYAAWYSVSRIRHEKYDDAQHLIRRLPPPRRKGKK